MCNPEPFGRIEIVAGRIKIRSNRLLKSFFAGMQTRGKSCGGVTKPPWGEGEGGCGGGAGSCRGSLHTATEPPCRRFSVNGSRVSAPTPLPPNPLLPLPHSALSMPPCTLHILILIDVTQVRLFRGRPHLPPILHFIHGFLLQAS